MNFFVCQSLKGPEFLERGFIYTGVGFALLILPHVSQISHENEIIWSH